MTEQAIESVTLFFSQPSVHGAGSFSLCLCALEWMLNAIGEWPPFLTNPVCFILQGHPCGWLYRHATSKGKKISQGLKTSLLNLGQVMVSAQSSSRCRSFCPNLQIMDYILSNIPGLAPSWTIVLCLKMLILKVAGRLKNLVFCLQVSLLRLERLRPVSFSPLELNWLFRSHKLE